MSILLFAVINAVVVACLVIYVNRRIERRLRPDQIMRQLRSEVESILTELNQTTERNIELIEDRVRRLQSLLDTADRRITVLKRESDKEDRTKNVYANLSQIAARRSQQGTAGEGAAGQGAAGAETRNDKKERASEERNPAGEAAFSGIEASALEREAEKADTAESGAPERSAAGQQPSSSKREQILELHRKGIAANIIANRVGSTIGEVELVISLNVRKE